MLIRTIHRQTHNFFWHFNYPNGPPGWVISNAVEEQFDTCYTSAGEYEVVLVAINKNGCTDTLKNTMIIYDPLIFKPVNIFTPNGDNMNDEFTFFGLSQAVETFQCTIVNRWGRTIYEMNNITDA